MSAQRRVVLVTGSARGLGLAAARDLARAGDRVHVCWRSGDRAPDELVHEFGERVHHCDLERAGSGAELLQAVARLDGPIDALVHAVGAYHDGALAETGRARTEALFASNVATSIEVMDAARAALREQRGAAVFFGVAGLDGLRARRECAAYAAAKSALCVLVRSWAVEEAPFGVRVNQVSPGVVPHAGAHAATLDPKLAGRIPFGRVGRPDDVAAAVSWLLSEEAAYTTGVDLPVAGGWML